MSVEPSLARADRSPGAGLEWPRLLQWSAGATAILLVALMLLIGGIIPPLIVFALLFAGGAWLVRARRRAGAIALAILFALMLLTNLPFIIPSLAVPASTLDFLPTVTVTLAAIVGLVSAIAVIRRRDSGGGAARMVALGAATVFAVAVVIAAVAKVAYPEVTARAGDISLVAEDFAFSERQITSEGGRVAVYVENRDSTLHTFTIERLGVDLDIPAGEPARIEFEAQPGTYRFVCVPHAPDMGGTLEVSG
jgi:plastocyanin